MSITVEDVRRAAAAISGSVVHTPCIHSRTLSRITGAEVHLKLENQQFTAAFKERGALNRLLTLDAGERRRGVVAMSAGNHAQAVACHAQRLGIDAVIVMPRHTPFVKVRNTRSFGADVHLEGEGVAEAGSYALELAEREDRVFVHPYDDDLVIAGQGTVALEMLEQVPEMELLLVPVGGGGLIGGCAVTAAALRPDLEVLGVQSANAPGVMAALAGEEPHWGPPTLAEGIAVKQPGRRTLPLIREHVAEVLAVEEPSIEQAILLLLDVEKTVVEGAGAVGLAAVLEAPERFRGRQVGIVVSGGNIDLMALSHVIQRALARSGRIVRLRVAVPDVPGSLARLTAVLAAADANIVRISHQRTFTELTLRSAEVEVVVETRDHDHTRAIREALEREGYPPASGPDGHPDPKAG